MTLLNHFQLTGRASKFSAQVFQPKYNTLQEAVTQTPLVIMLWGPRRRSDDWSRMRMTLRDTLQRQRHTIYFSEELAIPTTALTKKGVEFLPSEMADLVLVIQSSFDPIGAVRHFVEFRVIDTKMMMFIDETAPDQRLYQHALNVLQSLYNNIHYYKYPDDITESHLFNTVLNRVAVMQMVKFRAIQNTSHWGLRSYNYEVEVGGTHNQAAQPFDHNLLELYRNHREEVEVLTNPGSLFLLAYIHYLGNANINTLASEIGMPVATLRQDLGILFTGEMIAETDGILSATRFGKHLVSSVDMATTEATLQTRRSPTVRFQREFSLAMRLGTAMATLALLFVAGWYALGITGRNLPFSVTPTETVPRGTPVPTMTVTPIR